MKPERSTGNHVPVLMNLLPGLRDLRTPLAIGYLWIVGAWLSFQGNLPDSMHAKGIILSLYRLSHSFGTPATIAAVSFGAYILGSMIEVGTPTAFEFTRRALKKNTDWITTQAHSELRMKMIFSAVRSSVPRGLIPSTAEPIETAIRSLRREREQLATRLHAKNADLFSDYDRVASEATFRVNIGISLAGNSILLTVLIAPWFATLLPMAAWLFFRGIERYQRSNDVLIQALVIDEISTFRFEEFAYPEGSLRELANDAQSRIEKGAPWKGSAEANGQHD